MEHLKAASLGTVRECVGRLICCQCNKTFLYITYVLDKQARVLVKVQSVSDNVL
jgi:hypothetical protein